jgi:hypothetical protein
MGANDIRLIYKAISSSAGRTRTYNQWINSPAQAVRPVRVRGIWCCSVHGFRSVVLSGDVLSGYVRLHKWLQATSGLVAGTPERYWPVYVAESSRVIDSTTCWAALSCSSGVTPRARGAPTESQITVLRRPGVILDEATTSARGRPGRGRIIST